MDQTNQARPQPGATAVPKAPFDLGDTAALKTIGILSIVLHNYFHSLPKAVLENEFEFTPDHFRRFLSTVVDPTQTIPVLFSYLGHFGVQLFIFLSAYGLALKYWRTLSWSEFVGGRIGKLYPMFLLAVGLWLLLRLIEYGTGFPAFFWSQLDDLVLLTLGVFTLAPGYGSAPVGPWWFLPFIVQFYCLWPAWAAFTRRTGAAGLLALSLGCLALMIFVAPILAHRWWINLVETPLGHMPELCLGVAVARYGVRISLIGALIAAGVFVLGNLQAIIWPLSFFCALVMLLYAYQLGATYLRSSKFIGFVADVSMPLFFVNGFLRSPFRRIAIYFDHWLVTIFAGLGFAVFSVAVAYGLLKLERQIFGRAAKGRATPEPAG